MSFSGPLFVVGLSRSGTTLLRNLLNSHSGISLLQAETHFIPLLINRFGLQPDFSDARTQEALIRTLAGTLFFQHMTRREGYFWHESDFRAVLHRATEWETVIREIYRQFQPDGKDPDCIWGDKTPAYLGHLPLLKTLFPQSRFIHIIRDPRDRVLSVQRRWHKSLARSAAEWNRMIHRSREYSGRFGSEYHELKYESLLGDPEPELRKICDFLELSFDPAMMIQQRAVRRHGDAKGKRHIVSDNQGKFLKHMTARQIRVIEERAYPMMQAMGYEPIEATCYRPLSPGLARILALHDRFRHLGANVREHGLLTGLKRGWKIAINRMRFGGHRTRNFS